MSATPQEIEEHKKSLKEIIDAMGFPWLLMAAGHICKDKKSLFEENSPLFWKYHSRGNLLITTGFMWRDANKEEPEKESCS